VSWRPSPAERNPLLALRRVVEIPDDEDAGGGAVRLEPVGGAHQVLGTGGAGGTGGPRVGSHGRRRTRERVARPAAPERPVQALITSTPVETATRPDSEGGAGHAAAGPWSTLPGAPSSTPTLLRVSAGGSTATATGRTATVTNAPLPMAARAAPARADPSPMRPAPTPAPSARPSVSAARPSVSAARPAGDGVADPLAVPRVPLELLLPIPLPLPRAGRRPMTVVQVVTASTVALSLWALADAPALLHSAETAPLGARRTAALDVLRPLDRVSTALSIDRLNRATDALLHRHHGASATLPVTSSATGPGAAPAPAPHGVVTGRPPAATGTHKVAIPVALGPLRIGTAADPLRVLVIGDSIGLSFGDSMANKLGAGGIVATTVDAREGTGLTRPDAFDWGAELRADLVHFRPEVVIAMFGGNDDQDTIVNGRFIPFGSQAWTVIYGSRVAAMADAVHAVHAHLLWSGIPVVRSAAKSQRLQSVMAVTRAALAGRDGATFVDNVATLSDSSGHYTDALTNSSGQAVIVREPDGIHVSPAGADLLADQAIARMETDWHLVVKAPAPPPQ